MVRMNSDITIGGLRFSNQVHSVNVKQAMKQLTQRATIKLPRYNKLLLLSSDEYKIKVGQKVIIKLGYDADLRTEFVGYVTRVKPTSPIEIECEDEMWRLKQSVVTWDWNKVELIQILTFLVPGAALNNIPDITFEKGFRLDNVSKAAALEKLCNDYGLVAYYRWNEDDQQPELFVGLAYTQPGFKKVKYHFQKNAIADGLEFKSADEVKMTVRAISLLDNNNKIEVKVGDTSTDSGNRAEITLHFYHINSEEELKKIAEEKLKSMKYDGYTGSFKSFGLPSASHGDVASLNDDKYPERNMDVFIDDMEVNYDSNGFKRTLTIGRKATAA